MSHSFLKSTQTQFTTMFFLTHSFTFTTAPCRRLISVFSLICWCAHFICISSSFSLQFNVLFCLTPFLYSTLVWTDPVHTPPGEETGGEVKREIGIGIVTVAAVYPGGAPDPGKANSRCHKCHFYCYWFPLCLINYLH